MRTPVDVTPGGLASSSKQMVVRSVPPERFARSPGRYFREVFRRQGAGTLFAFLTVASSSNVGLPS